MEWAEQTMMEEEFDLSHFETLRDIISRLGFADVRELDLTWEDCEEFLSRLGYMVGHDPLGSFGPDERAPCDRGTSLSSEHGRPHQGTQGTYRPLPYSSFTLKTKKGGLIWKSYWN